MEVFQPIETISGICSTSMVLNKRDRIWTDKIYKWIAE